MPLSAMPEHLNSREKIDAAFPDDDQFGTTTWYGKLHRWYQKKTKTWFAFSYRCTESWARWRKYPKVLFAIKGKGPWRFESDPFTFLYDNVEVLKYNRTAYLSRIQYYTRWHFVVQWPLMVSFHFYTRKKYVPLEEGGGPDLDGKLWFFYWNHFDADLVYWMITSLYLGRNWK